jgi:hypothetical protein
LPRVSVQKVVGDNAAAISGCAPVAVPQKKAPARIGLFGLPE